jgi:hypothetical protein
MDDRWPAALERIRRAEAEAAAREEATRAPEAGEAARFFLDQHAAASTAADIVTGLQRSFDRRGQHFPHLSM